METRTQKVYKVVYKDPHTRHLKSAWISGHPAIKKNEMLSVRYPVGKTVEAVIPNTPLMAFENFNAASVWKCSIEEVAYDIWRVREHFCIYEAEAVPFEHQLCYAMWIDFSSQTLEEDIKHFWSVISHNVAPLLINPTILNIIRAYEVPSDTILCKSIKLIKKVNLV